MKSKRYIAFAIVTSSLLVAVLADRYAISFNQTLSLPGHLYLIDKKSSPKQAGDLVSFIFNRDEMRFPNGTKFMKEVFCVPGDLLVVTSSGTLCVHDGIERRWDAAHLEDLNGRPLQQFEFNGYIPENKWFVVAPHERSYDSRYWGFVDSLEVLGTGKELL